VLGLAARAAPEHELQQGFALVAPVAASAAPVALFLLGLYLWTHRAALGRVDRAVAVLVAGKLLMFPAFSFAIAMLLLQWRLITLDQGRVLVLLSGAPTAITTFAIAHEYGTGEQPIAQGIVLSTALSAVTLPAVVQLADWLRAMG
jgi:predicted permease